MTFPTKDLMLFEEVADDFNVILDAFGQNIKTSTLKKRVQHSQITGIL